MKKIKIVIEMILKVLAIILIIGGFVVVINALGISDKMEMMKKEVKKIENKE